MKENLGIKNFIEFIFELFKDLAIWIGSCATVQEILSSFIYDGINKFTKITTKEKITLFIYIILVIGMLIIIINKVYNTFKKEFVISVKNDKKHKIIIKIGNYEDNMCKTLEEASKDNKESLFIIGINDEVSMGKAERRGVHKSIIDKFYNDEEKCEILQERVNKEFNKEEEQFCEFGSIGIIDHDDNSKILFVVNSKHDDGQNTSISGPQPGSIIRKVFKALEKQSAEIVQIPILSSRNVRCIENNKIRFSVTIAEIIEQYFEALLNNNNIDYDLILSIRSEDLKENSVTINSIVKFIKELKPMYHIE
ncbi:hypothetical protein CYK66_07815 [Clostridium perfringens]|nr:hypothetical protein CYK66_07815 [Clostridium perfringens]